MSTWYEQYGEVGRARLAIEGCGMGEVEVFEPEALAGLPERAQRYLTHAIRPGVAVPSRARVTFTGELRMRPGGRWLRFRAIETLVVARGFVFSARSRLGPVPVTNDERYDDGHAESRIRLFGFVPVVTKRGPDADRAMRSRLIVESVWLPSTFLPAAGARWATTGDDDLRVSVPVHGEDVTARLRVATGGQLHAVNLERWSDLHDGGAYGPVPFEVEVEAEDTFGGCTIPSRLRAHWWAGTDRQFEFFRAAVQQATFDL